MRNILVIPHGYSPVVAARRLEAILGFAADVSLSITFDDSRVPDQVIACRVKIRVRGHENSISCLQCTLIDALECPMEEDLVLIDAKGFVETVNARPRELHVFRIRVWGCQM